MTRITAIALTALTLAVSGTAFAQDNCSSWNDVQSTCSSAINQGVYSTTNNQGQDINSVGDRVRAVGDAITTCTNCATQAAFGNDTTNSTGQ